MLTPRRIQKVATLSPEASCSRKISSHSMIDRRVVVMRASFINVMGGKRNGIRGTAAGWGLWSAYDSSAGYWLIELLDGYRAVCFRFFKKQTFWRVNCAINRSGFVAR